MLAAVACSADYVGTFNIKDFVWRVYTRLAKPTHDVAGHVVKDILA